MIQTNTILNTFRKLEAIQSGHYILTSGNHSDTYIQCARVLENPSVTNKLCAILSKYWKKDKVDIVAGPAVGGIIIAYELARILGARAVYLERVDNKLILRRGFAIKKNERVLVVEDVITTGGSAQEVIRTVEECGGKAVGVASLVDRSDGLKNVLSNKFKSLIKVTPPLYQPEQCPLCKAGIPTVKPGSRGLK